MRTVSSLKCNRANNSLLGNKIGKAMDQQALVIMGTQRRVESL